MKLYVTYGLIALALVAIPIGSVAWSLTRGTKTVVVTKTHTVTKTRPAVFTGTLDSLIQFLHPEQGIKLVCPKAMPGVVKCYRLGGQGWLVDAALAPVRQQGMAG